MCVAVPDVDARRVESLESESDVMGNLWCSNVLDTLMPPAVDPHSSIRILLETANISEFPLSLLTIQGEISSSGFATEYICLTWSPVESY
jgi:hypothetical protein